MIDMAVGGCSAGISVSIAGREDIVEMPSAVF